MNPLISVVIPEYCGAKMVHELVSRLKNSISKISEDFEIILVNDASPDNAWQEIERECSDDKRVKGLDLSRNFGQHCAITAGLHFAKGEWVVVMDCDLQDAPEEIPTLYNKAKEGWDIVLVRRVNKKFKFWKRFTSTLFHKTFNWLAGIKTESGVGNFSMYNKKVIEEFNKMPEYSRSLGSLVRYLGFKKTIVDIEHSERLEGKSSYTLKKLFKLAFDVIIAQSNRPLKVAVTFGFIISFVSMLLALYNVVARFIGIINLAGYTTTVFSIWFIGGMIMFFIGIQGLYINKIFDQVKGRQIFIVSKQINI